MPGVCERDDKGIDKRELPFDTRNRRYAIGKDHPCAEWLEMKFLMAFFRALKSGVSFI